MGEERACKKKIIMEPPKNDPLFASKPKAKWQGKDGGPLKVETAMMKQSKENRYTHKKKLKSLIQHNKDQEKIKQRSRLNPVISLSKINNQAKKEYYDSRNSHILGKQNIVK